MDDIDMAATIINQEIDRQINSARKNLGSGVSLEFCEDCERPIPEKRRLAIPGCTRCVRCQEEYEK